MPGKRLGDVIVAGQMRQRTLAAKGRDGAHDDARVELSQRLVVQAASLQDARSIVLNDHIHVRNQRPDQLDCLGLFEIETDALLAAILLDEVDAAAVLEKGDGT